MSTYGSLGPIDVSSDGHLRTPGHGNHRRQMVGHVDMYAVSFPAVIRGSKLTGARRQRKASLSAHSCSRVSPLLDVARLATNKQTMKPKVRFADRDGQGNEVTGDGYGFGLRKARVLGMNSYTRMPKPPGSLPLRGADALRTGLLGYPRPMAEVRGTT